MPDFRAERIGLTNAARLLGVSVTELKAAIRTGGLLRGVEPPKPMVSPARGAWTPLFRAGDVMDCAAAIAKEGSHP